MRRRRLAVRLGRMLVRLSRVLVGRIMIVFAVVLGGRTMRLGSGLVMLGGFGVMCLSHDLPPKTGLSDRRGWRFTAARSRRRIPGAINTQNEIKGHAVVSSRPPTGRRA